MVEVNKHFILNNIVDDLKEEGRVVSQKLGPGVVSGAADDDPSGIATYSQIGAQFGFFYLWLALYTFPLIAVIQEMCARIAIATKKGLAQNISSIFPKWILYVIIGLLFISNSFNIGADLGAMAEVMNLLIPQINPSLFLIFFAVLCIFLEVFWSYASYSRYLKWLTLALVSYIVAGLFISFDITDLLKNTFIPQIIFDKDHLFIITAVLGTTISPYLFFWQSSQEIEEEVLHNSRENIDGHVEKTKIRDIKFDIWMGMLFSNIVMFFIIAVCGKYLFEHGITDINSASDASEALRPIAGNFSSILFSIGVIGTGLLAIPVLAGSSAYALAESFRWKEGLYLKFKEARPFYLVIVFSVFFGLMQNFFNIGAFKALIYSAILNGIIAPIVIILVVYIASKKVIMNNLVNSKISTFIGILVVLIMFLSAIFTIFYLF